MALLAGGAESYDLRAFGLKSVPLRLAPMPGEGLSGGRVPVGARPVSVWAWSVPYNTDSGFAVPVK